MTPNTVNVWLFVMVGAMAVAIVAAVILIFWPVKGRVKSFRDATRKPWELKDDDGKPKVLHSEIDPEEALRLVLEQRMKTVFTLIAFAALAAVLSTIVLAKTETKAMRSNDKEAHATFEAVVNGDGKNSIDVGPREAFEKSNSIPMPKANGPSEGRVLPPGQ